MMKRFGIFGGTFNPPHIAHSIVAQSILEQLQLDKIIFIPSGNPPLKESISVEHRLAMAGLAFGRNPDFAISKIEIENSGEKSYTVNTLQKLKQLYKSEDVKFFLIIGMDNLIQLPLWKDPEKLFELSEVIVINRPDYNKENSRAEFEEKVTFIKVPFLEISSSMIRQLAGESRSVKYLVCDEVEKYILENDLYRTDRTTK